MIKKFSGKFLVYSSEKYTFEEFCKSNLHSNLTLTLEGDLPNKSVYIIEGYLTDEEFNKYKDILVNYEHIIHYEICSLTLV